ncbi:hypothetical protein KR074_007801 [Drosophila pseudoananassae]|nr:hypothetical protein KR074_007801 [Drosophila pseudoananassae]
MAPFSTCSRCQVRTRKLVRDPLTSKLIYICPVRITCFKKQPLEKKIETPKVLRGRKVQIEGKAKNPVTKPEDEKENIREQEQAKPEKLIAPGKPKKTIKPRIKITPPVMQTVVINGKKYIAVSETADDD